MTPPPEIALPERLQRLVDYCEKNCVAGCCGIAAFDFSPLHVASRLAAYSGEITPAEIADWEAELARAEALIEPLSPNEKGYLCTIAAMNQSFTRASFKAFIGELGHSIRVPPQVLEFSERIRHPSAEA